MQLLATVYLETSVINYLAGRMSRDTVIKAHQLIARKWSIVRGQSKNCRLPDLALG
jgi:hypothetical protein